MKLTEIIPLLKSCTQTSETTQIHGYMVKTGLDLISFPLSKLLASAIVDLHYAATIFNHIKEPNLFNFNTMLRGYSNSENSKQSLFLFNAMREKEVSLDQFSFICTLKSCTRDLLINTGRALHGLILRYGFGVFINIRNTLMHLYCSCGKLQCARQMFDGIPEGRDLVSWNTLMGGYLQVSQPSAVIQLFREMHMHGVEWSVVSALRVFSACGELRNLVGGESLHGCCMKNGLCSELDVITSIIDMYAKAGCMEHGRRMFDESSRKDTALWNCIIDGYVRNGDMEMSLSLVGLMKLQQVRPNAATLVGILSECASSGALRTGHSIHRYIEEEQLELDVVLGTALVDMYAKCGLVEKAVNVFDNMQTRDVKSWTALITGLGVNGQAANAIRLFYKMTEEGVVPNGVTFLSVLNACSHGGLVVEGKNCFEWMVRIYGFSPSIEHYGCMIDLLGRAGLLEEAYDLINSLLVETDATAWRALLAACRVHGNVELGEIVKRKLVELNDSHPTDSILLSSAYAGSGRWADVARERESEKEKMEMKKEAGCSSIERDGEEQ